MTRRELVADLKAILDVHNDVRQRLYPRPGAKASVVNENTVVRTAAILEAAGRKPSGPLAPRASSEEICIRTLFLFRHFIVHLRGIYRPRKLRTNTKRDLLPAFRRFRRQHRAAHVRQGERLCLAADAVLKPLIQGCIDFALDRPTRKP